MKLTKTGIFVPTGIDAEEAPRYFCTLCGWGTAKQREYEAHAVKCSEAHVDEIHEMSPRTKAPDIFDPARDDVELVKWMKDNARDVMQGRKKP